MTAKASVITLTLALASVGQGALAQTTSEGAAAPKTSPSAATSTKAAKPVQLAPKRADVLEPKAINARTSPKNEAPAAIREAPVGGASESCHHSKESDA